MMKTVKEIIYTVGDSTGSFAKNVGLTSADWARSIGSGTRDLARQIGPRRALIGFAILAAAVGGSILVVRYLRRREEARELESMETGEEGMRERRRRRFRRERSAMEMAADIG